MFNQEQVVRRLGDFTYEERELIVAEYLRGGTSQRALWRKYSGSEQYHGEILMLLRSFGYASQTKKRMRTRSSLEGASMSGSFEKAVDVERRTRDRYVAELEQRLKEAELKVALYESMIEIAEERFQIPIKKKSEQKPPNASRE